MDVRDGCPAHFRKASLDFIIAWSNILDIHGLPFLKSQFAGAFKAPYWYNGVTSYVRQMSCRPTKVKMLLRADASRNIQKQSPQETIPTRPFVLS
jgi:hypothetical protein